MLNVVDITKFVVHLLSANQAVKRLFKENMTTLQFSTYILVLTFAYG
jgi:hypothetical protein